MGKTKTLTEKQKQREELNSVLDYNETKLVAMQKQDWKDLNDDQVNILENFLATAIATMRICPPAYVAVASNNVTVRARAVEAINSVANTDKPAAVKWAQEDLDKAIAEGKIKIIKNEVEDVES